MQRPKEVNQRRFTFSVDILMIRPNYFRETDLTYRNHPMEYLEILDLMRQKFETVEQACHGAFRLQSRGLLLQTLQPLQGYPLPPANYLLGAIYREISTITSPGAQDWERWQEELMSLIADLRQATARKLEQSQIAC